MKKFTIHFALFIFVLVYCSMVCSQNTNINISQNPQQSDTRPMVAISYTDINKAVIIYTGNETMYSYTTNGGSTWSSAEFFDHSTTNSRPQVCADNSGNFYVAEMTDSNKIAVYKSINGGINFQRISIVPGAYISSTRYPSIAYDLTTTSPYVNTLYVAWTELTSGIHYISKSINGGNNWSVPVSMGNYGYGPVIALSPNGQINHVYFGAGLPGAQDVYHFNKSTDGGLTFNQDMIVDSGYTLSAYFTLFYPTIACDASGGVHNGNIYITFSAGNFTSTGVDCFLTRSTDNGNTWSSHVRISNDSVNNTFHHKPAIAINQNGNIAINYYDFRNAPGVPPATYFNSMCEAWLSKSTDGGITFTAEKLSSALSPRNAADHGNISIGYWGNKIIPVWTDHRDTTISYEIYTAVIDSTNTLSGTVTYRDNNQPVSNGFAKVLKYDNATGNIIVMDSTVIINGQYTFAHFPSHDSVDIMYYQNDDALDFVPTYYPSTIDWKLAVKIYATQNLTNIDGQVYRINNTINPFNVTGQCTQNNNFDITNGLQSAIIYAKIGNEFKNYGISTSNGNYVTTKLPAGSYTLTAYRMGFNEVTQNVIITNSTLTNINFNFGSPIGIQPVSTEIPAKFNLYQNYPNPFNPATTIKFDLPKDQNVKIIIYDIMGREVTTLADEELKAGTYNITWDASNIASGVYFYRIETNSFNKTKKLLLLK